tara:strand:+ start:3793 stop:4965 length:1173 start_codon:yes stop_codon:yes gene_type:complete
MKLNITKNEKRIHNSIIDLKSRSGSHSPSIQSLKNISDEINIKVDACFLSNPYATDLFIEYMSKDLISSGKLREYLEFYPSQNQQIAQLLSNAINVDKEKILIGNGATELIESICNSIIENSCVITLPTFSPYYEFLSQDVKLLYYKTHKENAFNVNLINFIEFVNSKRPNTVVIVNPNNPTGTYLNKSQIIKILDEFKFCENIILDESFVHFAYENESLDMIDYYDLTEKYKNLIIIKSMSKDFGVAGIRIGYAVMDPKKVKRFLSKGYLWNSNGIAEYFLNIYNDKEFKKRYEIERKRYINDTIKFYDDLKSIKNISCIPTLSNFVLTDIGDKFESDLLCSLMLIRHGIYTRNCDDKIGINGNYLRIASRSKNENRLIFKSLEEITRD